MKEDQKNEIKNILFTNYVANKIIDICHFIYKTYDNTHESFEINFLDLFSTYFFEDHIGDMYNKYLTFKTPLIKYNYQNKVHLALRIHFMLQRNEPIYISRHIFIVDPVVLRSNGTFKENLPGVKKFCETNIEKLFDILSRKSELCLTIRYFIENVLIYMNNYKFCSKSRIDAAFTNLMFQLI